MSLLKRLLLLGGRGAGPIKDWPSLNRAVRALASAPAVEVSGVEVRGVIVGVGSLSSTVSLVSSGWTVESPSLVLETALLGPGGSRRGGVRALGIGCSSMGSGAAATPRLHLKYTHTPKTAAPISSMTPPKVPSPAARLSCVSEREKEMVLIYSLSSTQENSFCMLYK